MFMTIAALILPLTCLFLLDVETFLATSILTNGLLICFRLYRGGRMLSQVVLVSVYSVLFAVMVIGKQQQLVPYTGSFVYGSLALLSLVGCLTTPWTLPRVWQDDPAKRRSHRWGNLVLLVGNLAALIISIGLFPHTLAIYLPLGLTIAAIPLSVWLPAIWRPRAT